MQAPSKGNSQCSAPGSCWHAEMQDGHCGMAWFFKYLLIKLIFKCWLIFFLQLFETNKFWFETNRFRLFVVVKESLVFFQGWDSVALKYLNTLPHDCKPKKIPTLVSSSWNFSRASAAKGICTRVLIRQGSQAMCQRIPTYTCYSFNQLNSTSPSHR